MRYLGVAEVEEMKKLREERWTHKRLAQHFGVCEATISAFLRGKKVPRKTNKGLRRTPYDPVEFIEEDFSNKPYDVLFEHVRVWDFIG